MVTKHVFCESQTTLFNFGHFFCPFLKSQNTFGKRKTLKYNKSPNILKEIYPLSYLIIRHYKQNYQMAYMM
jgi:hypothetical protein